MSTYSLQQLILSCMFTGIVVSILVTSIHSQWQPNTLVPISTAPETNSKMIVGLRSRIEQLQQEVQLAQQGQTPNSKISPLELKCKPCPTCSGSSSSQIVTGASAAVALTGSPADQAFTDYIELHKKILAKDPNVEQKFIVARPQAQMNNRLRVIVAGLALGMLTKRAFLVEFSDGYYASLADCFDLPIDIDLKHFDTSRLTSHDSMDMSDVETMLCRDYNTHFRGSSVDIGSPPNLIPFFWRNSHHQPQLRQWFGNEEDIYRQITIRFLKPSAIVAGMREKFMKEHFSTPGVYRLGVHLRWGGDHRPQPIGEDEWEDMVNCAFAIVPKPYQSSDKTVIYVAADTQESRDKALATLSKKMPQAKVIFYETWLRSNTPGGVQAALTELLLLAECDHLILTPHSSYGEQAMAIHGKPGYLVRSTVPNPARIQYTITHEVTKNCLRPYSIQPTIEHFSRDIQRASCYHPDMQAISF